MQLTLEVPDPLFEIGQRFKSTNGAIYVVVSRACYMDIACDPDTTQVSIKWNSEKIDYYWYYTLNNEDNRWPFGADSSFIYNNIKKNIWELIEE